MVEEYELSIPKMPGFSMSEWVQGQANLIHNLSKCARRNKKHTWKSEPMGDNLQTVPYVAEDPGVWMMVFQLAKCLNNKLFNKSSVFWDPMHLPCSAETLLPSNPIHPGFHGRDSGVAAFARWTGGPSAFHVGSTSSFMQVCQKDHFDLMIEFCSQL